MRWSVDKLNKILKSVADQDKDINNTREGVTPLIIIWSNTREGVTPLMIIWNNTWEGVTPLINIVIPRLVNGDMKVESLHK